MAGELARQKRYDAIICLARGDPRRDAALRLRGCRRRPKGIAHVSAETGIPVAFGVLTTNTLEQAIDRAGAKGGNKGFDAAMTAIEMANLMRSAPAGTVNALSPQIPPARAADPVSLGRAPPAGGRGDQRVLRRRSTPRNSPSATPSSPTWCAARWSTSPEVDERITQHAEHWRMERMPAVDRNILRLAVYEMAHGGHARGRDHRRGAGAGAEVLQRGIGAVRERRARRDPPRNSRRPCLSRLLTRTPQIPPKDRLTRQPHFS